MRDAQFSSLLVLRDECLAAQCGYIARHEPLNFKCERLAISKSNFCICLLLNHRPIQRMVPARGKAARKRGSSAKRNSTQHATALDILDLEVAARAFFTGRGQTVHEVSK